MTTTYDVSVSPAEIREAWTAIQAGENPFGARQQSSGTVRRLPDYRSEAVNSWIGASGAQIEHRLTHGYEVESKDIDLNGHAVYSVPSIEWAEDTGDLIIDAALSGEEIFRCQWEDTPTPRSLTIRACIGMHAGVKAEVLGAYMEWVLKVMDAAQRRGVIPSLELWCGTKGTAFSGKGEGESMTIRIPLVDAGEVIDVNSWRAYLTPGAFRSLGFVALALGADKTPRYLTAGMGQPTNKQWAVSFKDDVLDIECPGGADSFPEEEMDLKLEAAYAA